MALAWGSRFIRWTAERFELGAATAGRSLPMEGLRGVAVALVFLVHYCTLVEPHLGPGIASDLAIALHRLGNAGVDLFFVLSGTLIYGMLIRRPRPFAGFLARRVQRLHPAFLVVLAAYLGLSLLLPAESKLPEGTGPALAYILANLLMLPGIFDIRPIIGVAWSLSYEVFFYLTVPLLIGVLRLRSLPAGARAAGFLLAVVAAQALDLPHPRMGMFACGAILAEAVPWLAAQSARAARLDLPAMLAVPACAVLLLHGPADGRVAFLGLFLACFLVCAAAFAHRGPVAAALEWQPLRWLGNMSYSYYLVHGLMLKAMFFALDHVPAARGLGDAAFWILLPPAVAVTLAGGAVLYLAVERPFSILPSERQTAVPAAAAG